MMNTCDVSIIYASHTSGAEAHPDFSGHAFQVEWIPVTEDDVFQPRKRSLEAIGRASGRFTLMLDAGDPMDASMLNRMLQTAREQKDAAFVMPAMKFRFSIEPIEPFVLVPSRDLAVDTRSSQLVFPGDLHGLLIPTDALKKAAHLTDFSLEPEKQILLHLLEDRPVLYYLGSVMLNHVFPKECNTEYDMRSHVHAWYFEPFEQFLLPRLEEEAKEHGAASHLLQMLALYMMNFRIIGNSNNRNKHVLSREDVFSYVDLLSRVLQYVETPVLLRAEKECQPVVVPPQRLLFYMQVKKNDFSYYPDLICTDQNVKLTCDGHLFGGIEVLPMRLMQLDYVDGRLEIDGGYYDFLSDKHSEVCAKFGGKNYPLVYNHRYSMTKYFGVTAFAMKTFHVSIPVEDTDQERLLNFVLCAQGHEYTMGYNFPSQGSRFAKDFGYAYWQFGPWLSFWQKDGIHVVRSAPLMVLKKEVGLWLQMWKKKDGFYRYQIPIKITNFLLRPYFKHRKIWLFMDKIYKGADSSEYLYRYAEKQKDGIHKYYLLDKSSQDYKRMVAEGYRPLVRGSLKHRLVFLNADTIIASNSTVFAFNDYPFDRSLPMRGDVHFDTACVQHGMSVQKIAIAQQRLRDNTHLYFCASKYEIENLSKPVYDYVGYDALKLTGVPRYDGLVNRAQKIIVISPTWRMQSALPVTVSEGFARDYNPNFKETEYYRVYNGLINDERLLEAARRYGYRIQYVLHPIVSPQHEDFDKNDVVDIIPSIGDMSYEKIFCEGALMVTDFSGVQFDFAYMRKPVVYLHHNDIPQHYEEGTFHYDTMGFGEICRTNEELIRVLTRYMEHDCVMPEEYRRRADDFFAFSDHKNCERIYPILLEHTQNRK